MTLAEFKISAPNEILYVLKYCTEIARFVQFALYCANIGYWGLGDFWTAKLMEGSQQVNFLLSDWKAAI